MLVGTLSQVMEESASLCFKVLLCHSTRETEEG